MASLPATDVIADRGWRAIRSRLQSIARIVRDLGPNISVDQARLIVARYEPEIAAAIENSLLASWIRAGVDTAAGMVGGSTDARGGVYARGSLGSLPAGGGGQLGTADYLPPLSGAFGRAIAEAAGEAGIGTASASTSTTPATPRLATPPPVALTSPGSSPGSLTSPVRFPIIERGAQALYDSRVLRKDEFDTLANDAKRAAFTIARVNSIKSIADIRDRIAVDAVRGSDLHAFQRDANRILGEEGLSNWNLESVYRTQIMQARASGERTVLASPLVADAFPYVMYTAVHDSRVEHTHLMLESLGLNGTAIYRRDDPTIIKFWPPWRWSCRCVIIAMSKEDAARYGVREAMEWVRTGIPPLNPEWVTPPPFDLPKGWIGGHSTIAVL